MEQKPSQVVVEGFGIPAGGEIAVLEAPVGNGAADTVNDLPHAFFPLGGSRLAKEILAGNDINSEIAPRTGKFAVILLENGSSAIPFDAGGAGRPFDGVEGIADIFGAERRLHSEPLRWGNIGIERVGV